VLRLPAKITSLPLPEGSTSLRTSSFAQPRAVRPRILLRTFFLIVLLYRYYTADKNYASYSSMPGVAAWIGEWGPPYSLGSYRSLKNLKRKDGKPRKYVGQALGRDAFETFQRVPRCTRHGNFRFSLPNASADDGSISVFTGESSMRKGIKQIENDTNHPKLIFFSRGMACVGSYPLLSRQTCFAWTFDCGLWLGLIEASWYLPCMRSCWKYGQMNELTRASRLGWTPKHE
jgi:hypothetical protein